MNTALTESENVLRQHIGDFVPEVGIVLGTGLGGLVDEMDILYQISYHDIPHFALSTVESHSGKLFFGKLNGCPVVAMQGRFHYYEGYTMAQITYPIRLMKALGIKLLMVSNASGSLNPEILKGDLVFLNDHINLLPENPLRGPHDASDGPRFPDMSAPYEKALIAQAIKLAKDKSIRSHQGVYVATPGPNLETRAEYRFMRIIGGDVVGMSTVPEVIVANQIGLAVFAISVVTDEGFHADLQPVSLAEIVAVAAEAEPKMTILMKELIALR